MYYSPEGSNYVDIGFVKIAHVGLVTGGAAALPEQFDELPHEYFSVGQDVSYYENLKILGPQVREPVLRALRDTAFDLELFRRLKMHPAMQTSLLRDQVEATVTDQYHRIAQGGRTLVEKKFLYSERSDLALNFEARPGSEPPTNVHVVIGSNGVG
jgi:hypothetical protein